MLKLPSSRSRSFLPALIGASILLMMPDGLATQADPQLPPPAEHAQMKVMRAHRRGRSLRLSTAVIREAPGPMREVNPVRQTAPGKPGGGGGSGGGGGNTDPVVQTVYPTSGPPIQLASFDGMSFTGSVPPDTNAAVGDTQVVEVVNSHFAIYDKTGVLLVGPAPLRQMFSSLGSDDCAMRQGGDPVVLYDRLAARWLVARYVFATNNLCVAISQTSDATGAYNLYNYYFGPNTADYPKFGVWPDGYYFSANTFAENDGPFMGAQACAFDRARMLNNEDAAVICFQHNTQVRSLLPSDLDSSLPPPAGSPNYFLHAGSNALNLYKFRADFTTPANSQFIGPTSIPVAKFASGCWACVPQPGVTDLLEALGDRLMYRLSYRNFGSHESILATQTVQVKLNGSGTQTGVRWYEIRTPNTTPTVWQQSTFSPDAAYRWMSSIAQDRQGNMFLGFSASSTSVYPAIRYTARLATDPLNQMQREAPVQSGAGSQVPVPGGSGRNRWGDYASVAVDPVDGCTFWFATEYLTVTGHDTWTTRLFSAKFAGCS